MSVVAPTRRRVLALVATALLSTLAACGEGSTSANPVAGTYTATVFRVVPQGTTSALDIKASGGSIQVTIAEDNTTWGTLFVPKELLGTPTDFVESLAGRVTVTGSTLVMTQSADTFLRDLSWTVSGRTLSVTDQDLSGDRYTIVLAR